MSKENTRVLSTRPEVKVQEGANSPEEIFQNEVLRPIIKMQHDLLCTSFKSYLSKHSIDLTNKDTKTKLGLIEHTVRKNKGLRSQFTGMIIGHFTPEEFLMYLELESELNRRILNMVIQRLCSVRDIF